MFKKMKSFYNKDHYDISVGYVDPFDFHKIFYQVFKAFKVADLQNKNPPSYFNQNAILFIVASIATWFTLISLYHGLNTLDIPLVTEAGSYTFILCYQLFILYCTRRNLPQFHNLLRALQEDFRYICKEGKKIRAPYFENQLKTWKICIIMCIFCAGIPTMMNIFAYLSLFYYLATHDADVQGSRPLLFPFWMPDVDFGKTPVYEMTFMFANICVVLFCYTYTFMILTQIIWIRQITAKVDVIIWKIEDLLVDVNPATNKEESLYFSNLIEIRLREIVTHHHSMNRLIEDYAIVYKKLLLMEQKICSPIVCLSAYCLAEVLSLTCFFISIIITEFLTSKYFQKLNKGEFQVILLLVCVATSVLHFVPSFMCNYLNIEVRSICDACWNIPFWNAGPVIRPYMVLIMQRSLRPLPLQAPGFKEVSVETFSQSMTSAYSLFNMLRQTNL